ncbi:TPA: hypothetical protein ACK3JW_000895 [Mannheimia haemolytica]
MKFSKIKDIWQFIKEQGLAYQFIVAVTLINFILIFCFDNVDKTPLLMLFLSLFLMVITLTANLIKGEHKLKSPISKRGIVFITKFYLVSIFYISLSNSNEKIINWESLKHLFNLEYWCTLDNWFPIFKSTSELFFIIAVFLMGNLINFINPKKDE